MTSSTVHQSQRSNIYDPLPEGAYTRVLILEPGRRRQTLRCRLKVVNLEERPDYEAISYVWGRGIKRKRVICNGIRVKITPNLLQALVTVRHPSRQRTVWADSISINQSDDKEKGGQVALMGPIFNRARRVLIHLAGDDRGHAHRVATYVPEMLALARRSHENNLVAKPNQSIEREIQLALEDTRLQSFKYLLDHSWFDRGWVIQEAVLAQDAVVIWGSSRTAGMTSLMLFLDWLSGNFWGFRASEKHDIAYAYLLVSLCLYRFRDVAHGVGYSSETQPNLSDILYMARTLEFKDPRDRIYAFLYLDCLDDQLDMAIDAAPRLSIQPDYSKSVAEVYADFARCITQSGDITWLTYAQNTHGNLEKDEFASWIPRWDVMELGRLMFQGQYPSMHPIHHTSDDRQQELARFDGNYFIVPGVIFDRVRASHCYSSTGRRPITLDDVASFWRMAKTAKLGHAYSPEHLGMAVLDTLTQGIFQSGTTQKMKEREIFWDLLRAAEESLASIRSFGPRIFETQRYLSRLTAGRKLISTERGYFGLAPWSTKENDVCCIIFGCHYPFILREAEDLTVASTPRYRVIGDAWVAGKQAIRHIGGWFYMPKFGGEHSMEWETWGLQEGEITLI